MPRYIISAIFPLPHVFPYKSAGKNTLNATSPSLRALDFGVCKAIRLVRFSYNTFTGCVA